MFGKKKKKQFEGQVKLQPLNFSAKVLSVWSEAISGDKKCLEILLKSEYKALGLFVYALHLKDDARNWLLENGYAHLMAMINGIEGNKNAIVWLDAHGFHILKNMALSADGEKEGLNWLIKNNHKDMALIAKKIEHLKDEIEMDNNDVHKISSE